MTDYTSAIAGRYKGTGPVVECILNEGNPTYVSGGMMLDGKTLDTATWASPLAEGQVVAIENDVACVYAATEGMPVVRRFANAETLVIGEIITPPKLHKMPTSTDSDSNSIAKRLTLGIYRTALVEFHIPGRIVSGTYTGDGSHTLVAGVCTTLGINLAKSYGTYRGYNFYYTATAGVGAIPLTHVAASSDDYTVLVLLYGLAYGVTGA
jgi:hypothetical protein